ncbi:DNA repair protein RecO [Fischerella thermalis CCMEE 5198]|uniref:DNA repair protein RecO n=1 Tax=Fischerella thermalis TaxID=372787 RepID=UPI000C803630|nr:DNA repair protein RecO [Fischerella thermalis]PMB27520.1 DNA repair protein RecO [Fischerella thermalis CCMEE 5198]
MSRTYKATGINLKAQAFGESDRLVTVLTQEFGLIRVIAPGSRKHNSSLGGRSGMFVVNELLIAKGRSLDKITQAQTVKSYPGLAQDLVKLVASQYLAEIALCQALSEHPQPELYELLNEHLERLENLPSTASSVVAHLTHGLFQLLALAGLTPQVQICCLTGRTLKPDFQDPHWRVGFSVSAGGTVCLAAWERLKKQGEVEKARWGDGQKDFTLPPHHPTTPNPHSRNAVDVPSHPSQKNQAYETINHHQEIPALSKRLDAEELSILQQLSQSEIMLDASEKNSWLSVEQILRQYAQYHFGRPIRSAALIDSYFAANHDAIV